MKYPSLLLAALLLMEGALARPTDVLKPVGRATFTKLFWTLYDSTLYSKDGTYRGIEPGLALQISYRRNISNEQLLDSTREQWRKMSLYAPQASEAWLSSLKDIWPSVSKGDDITLRVGANMDSTFYFNGKLIGQISSVEFTRHFLAIWLSPKTRYPAHRKKLIGAGQDR